MPKFSVDDRVYLISRTSNNWRTYGRVQEVCNSFDKKGHRFYRVTYLSHGQVYTQLGREDLMELDTLETLASI